VNAGQARAYVSKSEEYLAAAANELAAGRWIAATSLAIHAAINAADAVTCVRVGRRAAGQDHDQVLSLLREAGQDGAEVERNLARLLPLKTKAEYEPDDIAVSEATRAVERAGRCVAVARRLSAERAE
jgi:HEPN domain-containing protein